MNKESSFFDVIEGDKEQSFLEEAVVQSDEFVPSQEYKVEHTYNTMKYEHENVEYPRTLLACDIPPQLKMVKNSKRENSLCLLKPVDKDCPENEKHYIRMLRGSIWEEKEDKSYELVNVCHTPFKIVVTQTESMYKLLENNGIIDLVDYYQDHIDGPLIRVYYHNGAWNVSTTSLIYADGHWQNKRSFLELFEETLKAIGGDMEKDLDKELSYYFIMCNPDYLQIIEIYKHGLFLKEARNKSFELVTDVNLPDHYMRLNTYSDWVIDETNTVIRPHTLYSVVLTNGDTIRVSNWMYEELQILKGNESHVNNMVINVLREPHYRIELFAYNFSKHLELLNRTNYYIQVYCDMLFKKYLKKESVFLPMEHPLQKNLYHHVKKMYGIQNQARESKTHILDIIHKDDDIPRQGHLDFRWRENYVRDYILGCSNVDISILVNMTKKFLEEREKRK